jgi:homoserine kinase type II
MDSVYVLQHCYELDNTLEVKFIGVYSSDVSAKAAIERLKEVPGFSEHPAECFYIDKYHVDEDNWSEGFYTV